MHRIIGLEFFRTGTHNNDYYGDNDLQAIADSYPELGYKAPLTCGHVNGPEARAWGWVERVYKKGQKLLADVVDIPETMFKTIKEKGFNAVSAEIFFNLTRNNKTYPRALRAIAVLGSSIPAAPVRRYVYNKEDHTMPNYADDSQRIDIRVHNSAVRLLDDGHATTMEAAIKRVLSERPDWALEYSRFCPPRG